MYDLRPFIQSVEQIVARHRLENPGEYTRWLSQNEQGTRNLGSTPYGCANAVNILYTIGALPASGDERQAMVRVLQAFQDAETGLFVNPGNYETHTTAFLVGALDLLGAKPLYTAEAFRKYESKEACSGLWTGSTGPKIRGWVPIWAQGSTPPCC